MRVKKFEAKTMKEALRMVKQELGPEAVILSARDNRKSFGLVGEGSVEITAAVSEGTLQKKHFLESRMREGDREIFLAKSAADQKRIIETAVSRRLRSNDAQSQASTPPSQSPAQARPEPRRPITSMSYIDIPDESPTPVQRTGRTATQAAGRAPTRPVPQSAQPPRAAVSPGGVYKVTAAGVPPARGPQPVPQPAPAAQGRPSLASSAGRSVNDLLSQYQDPSFSYAEGDTAAAPAQRSERALGHIRTAAREAWNSGLMADEERASKGRVIGAFGRLLSSSKADLPERSAEDAFAAVPLSRAREMMSKAARMPTQAPMQTQASTEIASLKAEIDRLHNMLGGLHARGPAAGSHPGADFGVNYDLSHMFQKLTDVGVGAENAAEILQACQSEMNPIQIKKRPMVDAWVARWLLSEVEVVKDPYRGRVHLFMGGCGSGKTSTLVKMASHLVVQEKRRVAILTTDADKVGAVDQLKIYCQILNVPLAIVRNKIEWEWALNQLQAFDVVLVDYPGLQLGTLDEIQLLKSMLPPESPQVVKHLVISSTSKDADALEIERRYRAVNFTDLIFTNVDQSSQHGLLYNVQQRAKKPLHSFGTGKRIPEDFEPATKEKVLDLIFKISSTPSVWPAGHSRNAEAK